MTILYFIPSYDPTLMGNRIHTEVIEHWRTHGVDAEVITLASGIRKIENTIYGDIHVHRLPSGGDGISKISNRAFDAAMHYPYMGAALRYFKRFISNKHYDLIHIETAFPLGLVAALSVKNIPLAVTLPGADIMAEPEFDYGYGRFRSVRMLLPFVFKRAAVLRADSPQIKSLAIYLGAPSERVTTIPYNITADSYPPASRDLLSLRLGARQRIVNDHKLDPQRPIIVSLNRLHPFKGIEYLVEALPELQRAGIRPQVLIIGPNRQTPQFGDYGAYLQQRAQTMGIARDIILTGAVPHERTLDYLAAADAVVVPSVAESFSRVVVEAAAAGTPPVVTRTTGVSDYVTEFGCGLVVEPRSGEAIGQALVQLLSDRALWLSFAMRCPTMAARFSSARIGDELLELYKPLMGRMKDEG